MSLIERSTTGMHELLELIMWKHEYDEQEEERSQQEHYLHLQHQCETLIARNEAHIAREIRRIREEIQAELDAITQTLATMRQEVPTISSVRYERMKQGAPSIIHRILTYMQTAFDRIDMARTWLAIHRRRMSTLKRSIAH